MRFFPEGIQISAGDGHAVENVTGRWICEDAITVNGGTGHRVADNVLVGDTDAVAGGGACFVRVEGSTCTADGHCPSGARCYCGELSKLGSCATPSPPPIWPAATPGQCYRPSRCGLDKAIQVNGGESTIEGNRIDTIQQPVHVDAGTHIVDEQPELRQPRRGEHVPGVRRERRLRHVPRQPHRPLQVRPPRRRRRRRRTPSTT